MTIVVDGIRFNVRLDGPETAPVLVLSNSLSSNLAMWEPQMAAFSQRYRVLRYDQRGHGGTQVSPRPFTMDRLADDVVGILDALGIAKAHFCGVSMGGMTGMSLLRRHRHRIDRAVLANTAAQMGPPDLWNQRIRTVRAGGMEAVVHATVERWLTAGFRGSSPEAVAMIRKMILSTPPEGYAACCAAIRDMDQRESIRGVTNPVLVIIGAHDPATTPQAGAIVEAAIPGARALTLDGAHLTNIEQPQAFSQAVMDFLAAMP
ncbi:3-oxoadipate enol-lactonase [Salinarimonas ramus]|uniref:3-oxoadipate enol-lactonase n=1 Tax=Salinarimonas ramus TaxID=690164 RepID=A0A917Q3X3_9HYPH|nr:3-oxoadipate enol-lactonase [Salinarimonas ramus]GGK17853.1 3-oxoadipate enol-lactonase [Salinarimonas ramus]